MLPFLQIGIAIKRLLIRQFGKAFLANEALTRTFKMPNFPPPSHNTRLKTRTSSEEQKEKYSRSIASLIPPIRVSPRFSTDEAYVAERKASIEAKIKSPEWFHGTPKTNLDQGNRDDNALRQAENTASLTKFRVSDNFSSLILQSI